MKSRVYFIVVSVLFVSYLTPNYVFAQEVLTLESSIEIALKNSIVLGIAREGVRGATAQKRESITGFLPKFNTSYSYTRLNEEPSFRFPGVPPLIPASDVVTGTKDNYSWKIEARQPLFTGGGLVASYQASSIGEDVAQIEETAKYQDVVQDVKIAYYEILRAQKIQETAQQSVEMLTAHRDVADNYFKVGMIPKNDLLHAEVELANGKQTLIKAQNAVEITKARFNTILKRKIFTPVEIVDVLNYQPFGKPLEECIDIALQNRPELKVATLKARQAGKLVNVARSEYFPTLSIIANYERFGDDSSVSGSAYKEAENWNVMGVASWNFWEWGKTKFRVDASSAKENQAIGAQKELQDQIALEIKYASLNLQEAEKQIAVSRQVIEQAQENFRISEERFKERVATSTEVLEAQTLLTKAKSEYANALGDYNINYAKLERAMGTIWP